MGVAARRGDGRCGNAAVQALDDGQKLTETFQYTMQDADGDQSSATLTITINGSNDTPHINVDPGNDGANDQVIAVAFRRSLVVLAAVAIVVVVAVLVMRPAPAAEEIREKAIVAPAPVMNVPPV